MQHLVHNKCSINMDGFGWMVNSLSIVPHTNSGRSGHQVTKHVQTSLSHLVGDSLSFSWGGGVTSLMRRMDSTKIDVIQKFERRYSCLPSSLHTYLSYSVPCFSPLHTCNLQLLGGCLLPWDTSFTDSQAPWGWGPDWASLTPWWWGQMGLHKTAPATSLLQIHPTQHQGTGISPKDSPHAPRNV